MPITITPHTEQELLDKLQTVRLKGFGQPEIYRNTFLEVYSCPIELLVPCQTYVMMERVEDLIALWKRVKKNHHVDVFTMAGIHEQGEGKQYGYLDITLDDGTTFPILPPIIERFDSIENKSGTFVHQQDSCLIIDGMHRVYAAKLSGLHEITCVIASKPDWPYYALPNEDGWDGVQEIRGELPDGFVKKRYRLPTPGEYKGLYRDFNSVFPGVQEERKRGLIS